MGKVDDLFHRAVAALSSGDLDGAEKYTRKLLKEDADNIEGLCLLVNIYRQEGQNEQALELAKRITELDPSNIQHWNTLGHLYLLLKRWDEAEKVYIHAVDLPSVPPTIFLNYALALLELGKNKEAKTQIKKAIAKSLEDELVNIVKQEPQYKKLRSLID